MSKVPKKSSFTTPASVHLEVPDTYVSKTGSRKRKRDSALPASSEFDAEFPSEGDLPSDLEAAIKVIQHEFSQNLRDVYKCPAVVTRAQLYSVLDNQTDVLRNIVRKQMYWTMLEALLQHTLKEANKIKVFKHVGRRDAYGILPTAEYEAVVRRIINTAAPNIAAVTENFLVNVSHTHLELFITKAQLKKMMCSQETMLNVDDDEEDEHACKGTDEDFRLLVRVGLLTSRDEDSYWMTIPNAAKFWEDLSAGRVEVNSVLKRQKRKELLLRDLKKKALKKTSFSCDFLLRDMIPNGMVESVPTTCGPLLRYVPNPPDPP